MSTQEPIPFPDTTFYPLSVVSCLCFLAFFKYVCPTFATKICHDFLNLPQDKQNYFHASVCSTVHALIVSCLCVYTILYETQLREDPVWGVSSIVKSSCAILVGYLAADTLLMFSYSKYDVRFILHHFASVFAYYYVMTHGVYAYFANLRLMAEFSTPWVNNRWFLDTMNMKTSKAYIVNGVVLTSVFFLCRIVTMPYCWYMIYTVYGTEEFMRSGFSRHVLVFSCALLDILNVVWFRKLCRGALKTIKTIEGNKLTRDKTE